MFSMNNNSSALDPYRAQSYSRTLLTNITRIAFGLLAMIGNGLILYTIARNPSLRRNLCNLLIGILAFADFWTGFGFFFCSCVTFAFQFLKWYNYTTGECLILQYFGLSGVQMSQIATIFIALDRLKAVQDPLHYSTQNRMRRFSLALAVTVLYSLIATTFIFIGIEFDSYPSPLFCNVGSLLTNHFVIYWQLFAFVVAITIIICYVTTNRVMNRKLSNASSERFNRELAKQRAMFRTISIVLLVYGLFWCLPNAVLLVATLLRTNPVLRGKFKQLVGLGSGINSSANVLVYAWQHNELGAAMRKVISKQDETIAVPIPSSFHLQLHGKRRANRSI